MKVDSTDRAVWKTNKFSKYVLKEIENKINEVEQEILEGGMIVSPALEREFCHSRGELAGLKFIVDIIEGELEEDEH